MFVKGREIPTPHSAIRLFSLLSNMKWAHLPVAGGLYDQHPDFVDKMTYIFSELNRHQEEERKRNESKNKDRPSMRGGRMTRGRRR